MKYQMFTREIKGLAMYLHGCEIPHSVYTLGIGEKVGKKKCCAWNEHFENGGLVL